MNEGLQQESWRKLDTSVTEWAMYYYRHSLGLVWPCKLKKEMGGVVDNSWVYTTCRVSSARAESTLNCTMLERHNSQLPAIPIKVSYESAEVNSFFYYFMCMWMCVYLYVYEFFLRICLCTMYARVLKKVSDLLELELQMVISHRECAGNQTWVLGKSSPFHFNQWAISQSL